MNDKDPIVFNLPITSEMVAEWMKAINLIPSLVDSMQKLTSALEKSNEAITQKLDKTRNELDSKLSDVDSKLTNSNNVNKQSIENLKARLKIIDRYFKIVWGVLASVITGTAIFCGWILKDILDSRWHL